MSEGAVTTDCGAGVVTFGGDVPVSLSVGADTSSGNVFVWTSNAGISGDSSEDAGGAASVIACSSSTSSDRSLTVASGDRKMSGGVFTTDAAAARDTC